MEGARPCKVTVGTVFPRGHCSLIDLKLRQLVCNTHFYATPSDCKMSTQSVWVDLTGSGACLPVRHNFLPGDWVAPSHSAEHRGLAELSGKVSGPRCPAGAHPGDNVVQCTCIEIFDVHVSEISQSLPANMGKPKRAGKNGGGGAAASKRAKPTVPGPRVLTRQRAAVALRHVAEPSNATPACGVVTDEDTRWAEQKYKGGAGDVAAGAWIPPFFRSVEHLYDLPFGKEDLNPRLLRRLLADGKSHKYGTGKAKKWAAADNPFPDASHNPHGKRKREQAAGVPRPALFSSVPRPCPALAPPCLAPGLLLFFVVIDHPHRVVRFVASCVPLHRPGSRRRRATEGPAGKRRQPAS